ncbi:MAG: hypothetical protein AB7O04_15855 [Hyphomonadaceae bacterium]
MIVFYAALYALLNRFAGGGLGWGALAHDHGGPLRGRPIYYVALFLAGFLGVQFGWIGVFAAANFLLWRLPGWYGAIDAGRDEGTRLRDFSVMSARGVVAAPFFFWACVPTQSAAPAIILAAASLLQGVSYDLGNHALRRLPASSEYIAGAVWGLAYAIVLGAIIGG